MTTQYPPLLIKYLRMFQDDPTSRIFAPLAESYRKIGLLDEAIEICREGLAANPDFVGGKVALARALMDKQRCDEVVTLLGTVVESTPDNLLAQRLYADSCLALGLIPEGLKALKMILYFNPQNKEVELLVRDLENQSTRVDGIVVGHKNPKTLRRLMKLQRLLGRVQSLAPN
jgi:tetratricopeptide (TPR) repeat protein